MMSTNPSTVEFIMEQIAGAGKFSARKMFGEYGIHCDGKFVACVCGDQLFVKPTAAGRTFLGEVVESPPYPGAKNYFLIARDKWDDAESMAELIRVSAAELPAKKK